MALLSFSLLEPFDVAMMGSPGSGELEAQETWGLRIVPAQDATRVTER